jgi:hypothetical protein
MPLISDLHPCPGESTTALWPLALNALADQSCKVVVADHRPSTNDSRSLASHETGEAVTATLHQHPTRHINDSVEKQSAHAHHAKLEPARIFSVTY